VYSLTTWAAWVESNIGLGRTNANHLTASVRLSSLFGVILYLLLNTCYTIAVFTDPGSPSGPKRSPTQRNGKYSVLPTTEPDHEPNDIHAPHVGGSMQNITVSSRGQSRYCKKCNARKPDRTHHCSTCKRCVVKMDHHCPWLATCLGLGNYKAFVLFLIYTSIFCWVCLLSSGYWLWDNIFSSNQYLDEYAPINIIMLAVISGIIGLVLTGFTGWHLYLCCKGQTTIECLEKTRYLSSVRSRVERNRLDNAHPRTQSHDFADQLRRAGDQILEFHANAVPGASRYEEGEEHTSPAPSHDPRQDPDSYQDYPHDTNDTPAIRALRRNYHSHPQTQQHRDRHEQPHSSYERFESSREADRYNEYLDDRDTEKMPNAFDLGLKRNLVHVFGTNPWLWGLPVCNSTGDGWNWEVSEKWVRAKEEMDVRRRGERDGQWGYQHREEEGEGYRVQGGMNYDGGYDGYDHFSHRHGQYDVNGTADSRSAVSMQTLNSLGQPQRERVWGGRYKKDVDRSGDDGEAEGFEVSGSDED
jgi:palmitoyltransferase ZDHHC2/15/20